MRRSSAPRPVVNSYKKVLNFAEASFAAGARSEGLAVGSDVAWAGQTSATLANVPTGAILKYIEIQFSVTNAVAQTAYINTSIQMLNSGQVFVDPSTVGGDDQRNQVFHQKLFSVGTDQNSNHTYKFKIPKKYQRMREGQFWIFGWDNSNTVNRRMQVIYKFYR